MEQQTNFMQICCKDNPAHICGNNSYYCEGCPMKIDFTPYQQSLYGTWQCCPVCGGSCQHNFAGTFNTIPLCNVCKGKGIISTLNGQPPI